MPNPPKACIYCGRFGGITKEHIWADWLDAHLPPKAEAHTMTYSLTTLKETVTKTSRRNGDHRVRKIRCVCGDCNSGWLSALQTQCKPTILRLINRESFYFDAKSQEALAIWCAMLSIIAEYIEDRNAGIAYEDCHYFYKTKRIPAHWRLWIGHLPVTVPFVDYAHNCMASVEKDRPEAIALYDPNKPNTQTTTIRVGDAIVHFMSSSEPVAQRGIRRWKWHALGGKLRQVWPIRSLFPWPLSSALTAEEALFLSERFYGRMVEIATPAGAGDR